MLHEFLERDLQSLHFIFSYQTLLPNLTFSSNSKGFHEAFAREINYWHRKLTLLDTRSVRFGTRIYSCWNHFLFPISPILSSNFSFRPPMAFLFSQFMRYARACSSFDFFILRTTRLSNKLFKQRYVRKRLKFSLRKFYGRYGTLKWHSVVWPCKVPFFIDYIYWIIQSLLLSASNRDWIIQSTSIRHYSNPWPC